MFSLDIRGVPTYFGRHYRAPDLLKSEVQQLPAVAAVRLSWQRKFWQCPSAV